MKFNAIFKNVKIIKIGLLDAKLQKILRRPGESEGEGGVGKGGKDRDEKSFLEPPQDLFRRLKITAFAFKLISKCKVAPININVFQTGN